MARLNKTREGTIAQKRSVCVAVIPFVEADVVGDGTGTGSVFVDMPERVLVQNVTSNITTASTTASATVDVVLNGTVLVNEMAVTATGVTDETLVDTARYAATGGELVMRVGSTAPTAGDLVGELVVVYIELDKTSGEYTKHLSS